MKKLVFLSAVILMSTMMAHAQIQKGNLMLGSDLGSGMVTPASQGLFGANFNLNKGSGWNIGLAPKIGYFVANNLLVGGVVDLGYGRVNSVGTTVWGIQALGRYYISPNQYGIDNILKHGRFFIEANLGAGGYNISNGGNKTNGFVFGIGPAYSYFLTSNVALEGLVKYNGLAGGGHPGYQSSIGVNFGVQVFLPSTKVRSMIKNPSQL